MAQQTGTEVEIFPKNILKHVFKYGIALVGIAVLVYLCGLLLSAAYGFLSFSIDQERPASLWSAVQHLLSMTASNQQAVYGWRFAITLLVLLVWVVLMLAAIDALKKAGPTGRYRAALIATAAFAPGIAAFATVVVYVVPLSLTEQQAGWMTSLAVIVGALVGLLVWLLAALVYRRSASPDTMNSRTYGELRQRLAQLDARLLALHSQIPPEPPSKNDEGTLRRAYYVDACLHRDAIAHELGLPLYASELLTKNPVAIDVGQEIKQEPVEGLRWIMGTGYMNLWHRLHRAEEALIQLNPLSEVIGDAVYDDMRLYKSNVRNCEDMRKNLRTAVDVLSRSATTFLVIPCDSAAPPLASSPSRRRSVFAVVAVPWTIIVNLLMAMKTTIVAPRKGTQTVGRSTSGNGGSSGAGAAVSPALTISEQQARGILREIRCSINTFRDSRWDALIQARNRCVRTGLLTSLAAYVLLCVAIINGAPPDTIVAVTAFYLVGALVGLFSRLREDTQMDRAVEDYGLATVRLIFTPLFCGLAAVGGVVLINLLPAVQAQSPDAAAAQHLPIDLLAIFSLEHNQIGLIVAAVFGLTPRLLIDRLLQATDQYKADLQNTEGGKATTRSGAGDAADAPLMTSAGSRAT